MGSKPDYISVSFACNDDYGQDTGHVRAISFDEQLQLEGEYMGDGYPNPRWKLLNGAIRFSRRTFPILGHKSWYGNMHFEDVFMTIEIARQFAEYVRDLGKYQCEMAYADIYEAWHNGDPLLLDVYDDTPY